MTAVTVTLVIVTLSHLDVIQLLNVVELQKQASYTLIGGGRGPELVLSRAIYCQVKVCCHLLIGLRTMWR